MEAPVVLPSDEPLSPEAARTVTPIVEASWHAELSALRDCSVQESSGPPPTDRNNRRLPLRVVHGSRDSVDEALIGVGRKIGGDLR